MTGTGWPPRRSPTTGEQALVEHGYAVAVGDRRLVAPVAATERVLAWLGGPTLGSAYKWALERVEYERRRKEVRGQ